MYFDTFNQLDVDHKCDRQTDGRTDGRTDFIVANTALNYATRPKAAFHCTSEFGCYGP